MKTIFGFLCILISIPAFSQVNITPPSATYGNLSTPLYNPELASEYFRSKMIENRKDNNNYVEGNALLFDKFLSAKISNIENIVLANYNLVTDEVLIKIKADTYAIYKTDNYGEIEFLDGKEKLVLLDYPEKQNVVKGYLFQIYSDKKYTLYKKNYSIFINGKEARNSFEISTPNKIASQKSILFFKKNNSQQVYKFPSKRKELIKLLPENDQIIKKFFKSKSLKNISAVSVINFFKAIKKHGR